MHHMHFKPYEKYVKRPLDFFIAILGTIVLSPLLLVLAVIVRIKIGAPVIFSQERPGKDERIFKLYKFRTMSDERDFFGNLLPDEERLSNFGRFLRSTSLDELPELINIIKGDMALVGPRPLLVRYLPYYTDDERKRHQVRPGLTGLSQITGRNLLSWDERFELDVKYSESISFRGDASIMAKTVSRVLFREDVVSGADHVMKDLDQERGCGAGGDTSVVCK